MIEHISYKNEYLIIHNLSNFLQVIQCFDGDITQTGQPYLEIYDDVNLLKQRVIELGYEPCDYLDCD